MGSKIKASGSRAALNDEVIVACFEETLATINKDMLNAKTQQEREDKWHEYHGLNRVWKKLKLWASMPETDEGL